MIKAEPMLLGFFFLIMALGLSNLELTVSYSARSFAHNIYIEIMIVWVLPLWAYLPLF